MPYYSEIELPHKVSPLLLSPDKKFAQRVGAGHDDGVTGNLYIHDNVVVKGAAEVVAGTNKNTATRAVFLIVPLSVCFS
jgi:hypothetical protein